MIGLLAATLVLSSMRSSNKFCVDARSIMDSGVFRTMLSPVILLPLPFAVVAIGNMSRPRRFPMPAPHRGGCSGGLRYDIDRDGDFDNTCEGFPFRRSATANAAVPNLPTDEPDVKKDAPAPSNFGIA
mmetsp:Transcript_29159/g.66877  ORF Transcript_29159/g.66877 Transcript_29159/m.66877 type:complete len:128 (-) Transcript_29159:437-820(-)